MGDRGWAAPCSACPLPRSRHPNCRALSVATKFAGCRPSPVALQGVLPIPPRWIRVPAHRCARRPDARWSADGACAPVDAGSAHGGRDASAPLELRAHRPHDVAPPARASVPPASVPREPDPDATCGGRRRRCGRRRAPPEALPRGRGPSRGRPPRQRSRRHSPARAPKTVKGRRARRTPRESGAGECTKVA